MPNPGRCFRGPTRAELLARIRRAELLDGERVFLGQGVPSAVLRQEDSGWVVRELVAPPRKGPPVPLPPGSWPLTEPGAILAGPVPLAELAPALEALAWRWDPQ